MKTGTEKLAGQMVAEMRAWVKELVKETEARRCSACGGRRRHKGLRPRGVLGSAGGLRLVGVYWYCRACGRGQHAADAFLGRAERFTPRLREAAQAMGGAHAGRIFPVSDAADWIDKGVAVQLPGNALAGSAAML